MFFFQTIYLLTMALSNGFWTFIILGLSFSYAVSKGVTFVKMTPTIPTTESLPVLDDFFWYFAFGSNLLKERIRVQVSFIFI